MSGFRGGGLLKQGPATRSSRYPPPPPRPPTPERSVTSSGSSWTPKPPSKLTPFSAWAPSPSLSLPPMVADIDPSHYEAVKPLGKITGKNLPTSHDATTMTRSGNFARANLQVIYANIFWVPELRKNRRRSTRLGTQHLALPDPPEPRFSAQRASSGHQPAVACAIATVAIRVKRTVQSHVK